jgi:lipopolysaccharide/colanic/teichoic acid biosynthesis glycosyltransferase
MAFIVTLDCGVAGMPSKIAKTIPATAPPAEDVRTVQSGLVLLWQGSRPVQPLPSLGRQVQLTIKRGMDVVLAGIGLAALGPLLLLIALAIRIGDPGPIFFRQEREGRHGVSFRILKFRTMSTQPHALGDPFRTTVVGQFLRRTSLDELPQLLNVMTGEMALVGPRPHIPEMPVLGSTYPVLVPYYAQRFAMRPGITGWAQANGLRGPLADEATAIARVDHDLAYIQNFSLLLDLRIMWLTLRREFLTGTGR